MSTNQKVADLKFRVTKLENKMKQLSESTPESLQFRECPSCAEKPGMPQLCPSCLSRRSEFLLQDEMERLRRNFQKAFSGGWGLSMNDLEEDKVEIRRLEDLLRSECKKLTQCQAELDRMHILYAEKNDSYACPHCNTPAEIAYPGSEKITAEWWSTICSVCGCPGVIKMSSQPRIVEVLGKMR